MPSLNLVTSLTNVKLVGAGSTIDFATAKRNVSMALIVTGTVTGGLVLMEVSQDGVNWIPHTSLEPMTGLNVGLDNKYGAYRYWRASVISEITGGGSVTTTFMEAG